MIHLPHQSSKSLFSHDRMTLHCKFKCIGLFCFLWRQHQSIRAATSLTPLIKTLYRSILCPTNLVPHSGHCFECVRWCKMNYLNYWQQYVFEGIICVEKCNDDMSSKRCWEHDERWKLEDWLLFLHLRGRFVKRTLGFTPKIIIFFNPHFLCECLIFYCKVSPYLQQIWKLLKQKCAHVNACWMLLIIFIVSDANLEKWSALFAFQLLFQCT